eukprot:332055-Pyramimonas_sp.AAC.1
MHLPIVPLPTYSVTSSSQLPDLHLDTSDPKIYYMPELVSWHYSAIDVPCRANHCSTFIRACPCMML